MWSRRNKFHVCDQNAEWSNHHQRAVIHIRVHHQGLIKPRCVKYYSAYQIWRCGLFFFCFILCLHFSVSPDVYGSVTDLEDEIAFVPQSPVCIIYLLLLFNQLPNTGCCLAMIWKEVLCMERKKWQLRWTAREREIITPSGYLGRIF